MKLKASEDFFKKFFFEKYLKKIEFLTHKNVYKSSNKC